MSKPQDTRRVRINVPYLQELLSGRKLEELAAAIPTWRKQTRGWEAPGKIHPSTLSRIARGLRHPELRLATAIAHALGRDPVELIVGFAEPANDDGGESWWTTVLRRRSTLRAAESLLGRLRGVASYVHPGHAIPAAAYRVAISCPRVADRYGHYRLRVAAEERAAKLVLSFRLEVGGLALVIDYGEIVVDGDVVRSRHLWTFEASESQRRGEVIQVRNWLDGTGNTYYVRSETPFEALDREALACEPPEGAPVASFSRNIWAELVRPGA